MASYKSRKTDYYLNNRIDEIHSYSINIECRELFLQGSPDDNEVDYIMAYNTIKNIRFLESLSYQPIIIHHYNIGGGIDEGFAIYDIIKSSSCHITIVCHGICASMGSVITQAADQRICMPNCSFLLHEGNITISGTLKESGSYIEYDKKVREKIAQIYKKKIKQSEKYKDFSDYKIRKMIQDNFDKKSDWYLDSNEALEYGLVDYVLGPEDNLAEVIDKCTKN